MADLEEVSAPEGVPPPSAERMAQIRERLARAVSGGHAYVAWIPEQDSAQCALIDAMAALDAAEKERNALAARVRMLELALEGWLP